MKRKAERATMVKYERELCSVKRAWLSAGGVLSYVIGSLKFQRLRWLLVDDVLLLEGFNHGDGLFSFAVVGRPSGCSEGDDGLRWLVVGGLFTSYFICATMGAFLRVLRGDHLTCSEEI